MKGLWNLVKSKIKYSSVLAVVVSILLTGLGAAYSIGRSTQNVDSKIKTLQNKTVHLEIEGEKTNNKLTDIMDKFDNKMNIIIESLAQLKIDIAVLKTKISTNSK